MSEKWSHNIATFMKSESSVPVYSLIRSFVRSFIHLVLFICHLSHDVGSQHEFLYSGGIYMHICINGGLHMSYMHSFKLPLCRHSSFCIQRSWGWGGGAGCIAWRPTGNGAMRCSLIPCTCIWLNKEFKTKTSVLFIHYMHTELQLQNTSHIQPGMQLAPCLINT